MDPNPSTGQDSAFMRSMIQGCPNDYLICFMLCKVYLSTYIWYVEEFSSLMRKIILHKRIKKKYLSNLRGLGLSLAPGDHSSELLLCNLGALASNSKQRITITKSTSLKTILEILALVFSVANSRIFWGESMIRLVGRVVPSRIPPSWIMILPATFLRLKYCDSLQLWQTSVRTPLGCTLFDTIQLNSLDFRRDTPVAWIH